MKSAVGAVLAAALIAAAPARHEELVVTGEATQGALLRGQAPAGAVTLSLDGAPVDMAPDGRFLIAFDRDAGPLSRLEARLGDGRTVVREIPVAPRTWRIQHLSLARRPPGAAFLRLREAEVARISAARSARRVSEGWRQTFQWPAQGRISGVFGSQRFYRGEPGAPHSGVDVAAGAGAPVVAPADGIVVLASPPAFSLEGNLVMVDHGLGLVSAFLHLASVAVREGETVRQGQRLGTVGATGRATGPHLHWSLSWNGARVDPARFAAPMGAIRAGASPSPPTGR
ncbi:MAG TPA: M23 family metallopeptidase [Planctomycetota bacterium]|nr:M23 family metallopeptidase [Planctomycetota bacterium]